MDIRHKIIKLLKLFVSFSDEGEDKFMIQYFMNNGGRRGTYLDIGAYHPFKVSNTFLLYIWGWRGTCIDINKKWLFRLLRPRDKFIYGYVEASESYLFPRMLFTSDPGIAKDLMKKGNECHHKNTPRINATDLPYADLLDLDVDGIDEMILKKYLSVHKPKWILTEDRCLAEQGGIQEYLTSLGYNKIGNTTRNGFYEYSPDSL